MQHTHYEVWAWPEGGAPQPEPPNHPVAGWPEDTTYDRGDLYMTEDLQDARNLCTAWREHDPEGQYRVVKVTCEVLVG